MSPINFRCHSAGVVAAPASERIVVQIKEILRHNSGSKMRIYARPVDDECLTVITTVGAEHLSAGNELALALNIYLFERDEANLTAVLERLPEAVNLAVQAFVAGLDPLEVGDRDGFELIADHGCAYHSRRNKDLLPYVDSADMVNLGVRMESQQDSKGNEEWKVVLRSMVPFVTYEDIPRAWALPDGIELERSWTSVGNPAAHGTETALEIAEDAADEGKYVRMHTFWRTDTPDPDGRATLEYVVDVFNAPMPVWVD